MFGRVTRQNICQPLAPRLTAAISSSAPIASITGISSRATKGKVTNAVARTSPGVAKMIFRLWSRGQMLEVLLDEQEQREERAAAHPQQEPGMPPEARSRARGPLGRQSKSSADEQRHPDAATSTYGITA